MSLFINVFLIKLIKELKDVVTKEKVVLELL